MQKIVIFDFDKTLITENSFPLWVYFIVKKSAASINAKGLLRVIFLLFKRKIMRNISHVALKESLLLEAIPERWHAEFARTLLKNIYPAAFRELESHIKKEDLVIISSAAPVHYLAEFIKEALREKSSLVTVIGSEIIDGVLFDNYKEGKVSSLHRYFPKEKEFLIDALYTDSWDDHCLAAISKSVILVNPGKADIEKFERDASLKNRIILLEG